MLERCERKILLGWRLLELPNRVVYVTWQALAMAIMGDPIPRGRTGGDREDLVPEEKEWKIQLGACNASNDMLLRSHR